MGRRTNAGFTLLSRKLADEKRALLVFDDPTAAEAFLVAEGLGSEWRVIGEAAPWGTAKLLRAAAEAGVGYVALNPPSVFGRGDGGSRLVLIEAFVEHLPNG